MYMQPSVMLFMVKIAFTLKRGVIFMMEVKKLWHGVCVVVFVILINTLGTNHGPN